MSNGTGRPGSLRQESCPGALEWSTEDIPLAGRGEEEEEEQGPRSRPTEQRVSDPLPAGTSRNQLDLPSSPTFVAGDDLLEWLPSQKYWE